MAQSILTSTKKMVGLSESDTSFDMDVMIHINSVFSKLNQLGVGPEEGFEIEGALETWDAFFGINKKFNFVKSYVYLSVRMLFDPPSTSFTIKSTEETIRELEWRINALREEEKWTNPFESVT